MQHRAEHTPVLREEVLHLLSPADRNILVDCTIGLGGHAYALLRSAGPQAQLIGIDSDESNLLAAKNHLKDFAPRVRLFHANFSDLPDVLAAAEISRVDAILADLGVCSTHLDDPKRGFSFSVEGPLDMRMDPSLGKTAADLVNSLPETQLADLIYEYGEERYSRRVAGAICRKRIEHRIETTAELAEICSLAYPVQARRSRKGVHPATRTFQALRIAVNDELGNLETLLQCLPKVLSEGGRAAVISFHSLEDRRVKQAFAGLAEAGLAKRLSKKPIVPTEEEIQANPRSRSAKLRGIEMTRLEA